MRHTKAVLRIYNYIVGLEQYPFGERVIDLGRVACLAHDIQKSGTEEYYNEKLKDGKKYSLYLTILYWQQNIFVIIKECI